MNFTLISSSNNSIEIIIETWFIPLDIITIVCTILGTIISIFFLLIILYDKTCHTTPMLLVANTCLAELLLSISRLTMTLFTLQNDLTQIYSEDPLCVFRGYLNFSSCALQNLSYLLQSIHRYFLVHYPNRLFWQTKRAQLLFILLTWLFAFVYPIPFLFTGEMSYDVNNQICQVPLRFSISILYTAHCIFVIPITLIMFVYFKLIRYVKDMSKRITSVNTIIRAQRELKMVRRIVILVMILFVAGFPYSLFVFMSFLTRPPKYHFRIAFAFIDLSLPLVMISLFQFNDTLKTSVKKIFKTRPNIVVPVLT